MAKMKVRLTLLEEILGTAPNDADVYGTFIGLNAPDAPSRKEEIEALGVDAVVEKGMTVFPRNAEGNPIIWDYQIKGFMKDACGMLRRVTKTKSSAMKAYKKVIDGLIFIEERQIPFSFSGEIGDCQRPLRAQTAQGERVSLAKSETIPAGATIEFTVNCLVDADMEAVREWLDYGKLRGLGQWRNSGKGRYSWDELDENGNVIGGNNEFTKR